MEESAPDSHSKGSAVKSQDSKQGHSFHKRAQSSDEEEEEEKTEEEKQQELVCLI